MRKVMRVITMALVTIALAGCVGVPGGDPNLAQPPADGYIPTRISNLTDEGSLPDNEPAQQHDGGSPSLSTLEGQWICEEFNDEHRDHNDPESYVVTKKTMMLNGKKVERLPRSIDIRPYSPVQTLLSRGFGYGAVLFADASDPDETGVGSFEMHASHPYGGNGFVCAANGSTLALGIVESDEKMDDDGIVVDKDKNPADECALTELDYEVNLDGDRLIISDGDVSATYVVDNSGLSTFHDARAAHFDLYNGDKQVDPFHFQNMKKLSEAGYDVKCNMDEMLQSLESSKEFMATAPDGSVFKVKAFNPYEKSVPLWNLPVSWCQYEGGDGNLTLGMGTEASMDIGATQVFGSSKYAQVYNYYPLPYESASDYLCYKAGYRRDIGTITAYGAGFDTGNTLVQSEHSCDIRIGFKDGVMSSLTKEDTAYMTAGMQDNIKRDDLDELQPSVYREVEEQRDKILDELKKAFKGAGLDAAINESTGEVVMDNNVLFASGSYELTDEGKKYLDKVFPAYASVVLDDKFSTILESVSFEGNTDSDGSSESNMRLSESRASAVMEYCSSLLDGKQREAFDKLATYKGYGETDLVYDEKGNENKDASRRVAIKFMMKVDDLMSEAEPKSDSEGSSSASSSSSSSSSDAVNTASSGGSSDSSGSKDESDELKKFKSISGNFNQAWLFNEKSGSDNAEHFVGLLLSDDHRYCAYMDLKVESSIGTGHYTFGETSVKDTGKNMQEIIVKHENDNDKLNVVFNAWKSDNKVSITDPWGGVNNLTAHEDVDAVISTFEKVIAQ